jgi:hypothetical protein
MSKMLLKTFSFYFISSLSFTWSQTIISVPKLAWLKFCLINLVIVGSQMLFDQTMTIKILYTLPHKSTKGGIKWTIELANHWKSHILVIERRELESHSWKELMGLEIIRHFLLAYHALAMHIRQFSRKTKRNMHITSKVQT